MRNVIAHEYGDVDYDLLWHTMSASVPQFAASLGGWCFSEGFGLAGAVELHGCHWVSRGGSCGDGGCGAVSG